MEHRHMTNRRNSYSPVKITSRPILIVFCLLFGGIQLTAQESLSSFNRISITGSVKVTLKKGDKNQYTATGETDKLKVTVDDGKLRVSRIDINDGWKNPAIVTVWYTDLRSIACTGGAELAHEGTLAVGDFELNMDAGAHGDLEFDAQSLEVSVGEGAVLRLTGSSKVVEADATTGGILKARDLVAHRVYVNAHTGASATVHATEEIDASATLGGSVSYSGSPATVRVKESLGGSVRG